MIYFVIAWLLLVILLVLLFITAQSKDETKKQKLFRYQQLILILMLFYSIIGIITKDPLITDFVCNKWYVCVSDNYEWIAYLAILGFFIWKIFLVEMKVDISDLKQTTTEVDKRLVKVETTLDGVKDNVGLILQKIKMKF